MAKLGKKAVRKATRLKEMAAERARVRDEFGYSALKAKHKVSKRPDLPDYTVEQKTAPTTALFGPTPAPRGLPPDAKEFPVGNSHKQGLELILPKEVEWMSGKKS